jgi:hypothetical protein
VLGEKSNNSELANANREAHKFSVMKTKLDKLSESAKALALAESKVKICDQVADADKKQAHAAKMRFKNGKKAWKLARKKAKQSAKLAKLAKKNLAALAKHLKRIKKKAKPAKLKTTATAAPKGKTKRPDRSNEFRLTEATLPQAAGSSANPAEDAEER